MPRYIPNTVPSLPVTVLEDDESQKTLPAVLAWTCKLYQPSAVFQLKNLGERRALNKAIDTLEGEPTAGYYVLDNDEFKIVKSVVEQVCLTMLQGLDRNAPALVDAMDATSTEPPGKEE